MRFWVALAAVSSLCLAGAATDDSAAVAPTLLPVIHPSLDPSHVHRLRPVRNGSHLYTEYAKPIDPTIPTLFAEATITYQHPTVHLPHSDLISYTTCLPSGKGLKIGFDSEEAYDYVETHWSTHNGTGFVLVTSLSCAPSTTGKKASGLHVYWLVSSLAYQTEEQSVTVTAEEIAVERAYDNVDMSWGRTTPQKVINKRDYPQFDLMPGQGAKGGAKRTHRPGGPPGSGSKRGLGKAKAAPRQKKMPEPRWRRDDDPSARKKGYIAKRQNPSVTITNPIPSVTNPVDITTPDTTTCFNPPSSYLGLATAPCGDGFDSALDAKIGFLDFTNNFGPSLATWAPGLATTGAKRSWLSAYGDERGLVEGSVEKRGFLSGVSSIATSVGNGIANGATQLAAQAAQAAINLAQAAAQQAAIAADALQVALNALTTEQSQSFEVDFPIDITYGEQVDSPWGGGDAYEIYSSKHETTNSNSELDIYCVNCGVTGGASLGGAISFRVVTPSVSEVTVSMKGNLQAGVNLGISATAAYQKTYSLNLITFTIPEAGVNIADLLVLGMALTVDATVAVDIKAAGQILVGGTLSIVNMDVEIDLLNPTSTQALAGPSFNTIFDATGQITASLGLALPVEFGMVLAIPPIDFEYKFGVRNTPLLTSSATFELQTGQSSGGNCDNGLSYQIGFSNAIDFDIVGSTINLYTYNTGAITSGCFLLPIGSTAAPTSPVTASQTISVFGTASTSTQTATSTASTTAPTSLPTSFSVAQDSPVASKGLSNGVEWAEIASAAQLVTVANQKIQVYGYTDTLLACAQACSGTANCVASTWDVFRTCTLTTGTLSSVQSASKTTVVLLVSCDTLTLNSFGAGAGALVVSCLRFFPPPPASAFSVASLSPAPDSRWTNGLEWAYFDNAAPISYLNIPGTGVDDPYKDTVSCALWVNQHPQWGWTAASFDNSAGACVWGGGTAPLKALQTSAGESTIVFATCTQLSSLNYGPAFTCQRFFPVIFPTASDTPEASGTVEWSEFPGVVLYNPDQTVVLPPCVGATCCAAYCEAQAGCVSSSWIPGTSSVAEKCTILTGASHATATAFQDYSNAVSYIAATCLSILTDHSAYNFASQTYPGPGRTCYRFFPNTAPVVHPFDYWGISPFSTLFDSTWNAGLQWAFFGNTVQLASIPGLYSTLVAASSYYDLYSCANGCGHTAGCIAATWESQKNKCTWTMASAGYTGTIRAMTAGNDYTYLLVLTTCYNLQFSNLQLNTCTRFLPTFFPVAADSPAQRGSQEWAEIPNMSLSDNYQQTLTGFSCPGTNGEQCCATYCAQDPTCYVSLWRQQPLFAGGPEGACRSLGNLAYPYTVMGNDGTSAIFKAPCASLINNQTVIPFTSPFPCYAYYPTTPTKRATLGAGERFERINERRQISAVVSKKSTYHTSRYKNNTNRSSKRQGLNGTPEQAMILAAILAGSSTGSLDNQQTIDALQAAHDLAVASNPVPVAGYTFIPIVDADGTGALAPDGNNNIFLQSVANPSSAWQWGSQNTVVDGDGNNKGLFYYQDEMDVLGVSRLRFNMYTQFPLTSRALALAPLAYPGGTMGVYIAASTTGNIFYPILCSVAGKGNQVFVANDINAGIATLQKPELQYVVTGGVVGACTYLALFSPGVAGFKVT